MAVARIRNEMGRPFYNEDEEGGGVPTALPPSIEMGLPASDLGGVLRQVGDPAAGTVETPLGSVERPGDRAHVPTGAPPMGVRRAGATPSRPMSPTPVAAGAPDPMMAGGPSPQQVARQPLVLGSRQGPMLGGPEALFGGGFGAAGQEELTPKSILQTLLQLTR